MQHQHLQDFRLLLFAAGEADVQIALCVAFIHRQKRHRFLQLLLEVPQADAAAALLLQRRADKGAQRHARHFQRVLEGQENAFLRALIDGHRSNILAVKRDAPPRHLIGGVAGDGIAEGGFARAVRAKEDMGFIRADGKVDPVEDFLFAHLNVQVADGQQFSVFHIAKALSLAD